MQAKQNLNDQLMMDHWLSPHQSLEELLHLPNKEDYLKKQALGQTKHLWSGRTPSLIKETLGRFVCDKLQADVNMK